MKTSKLDQHFLKDEKILDRIIESAEIKPDDAVLEIGAGKGILTIELAKKARRIIAIELDQEFKPYLGKMLANVEVRYGNALKIIGKVKFNKIVANIPYNISEPLLKKLFRLDFEIAVLLVGKNFYDVLTEKSSKWAVITPLFFEIEKIIDVPRESFEPAPRVDSVVIKLSKRQKERELSLPEQMTKEIVLQDDKKLRNALITSFARVEKLTQKQAEEKVSKLKLPQKLLDKRVEHLSNRQFIAVFGKLSS